MKWCRVDHQHNNAGWTKTQDPRNRTDYRTWKHLGPLVCNIFLNYFLRIKFQIPLLLSDQELMLMLAPVHPQITSASGGSNLVLPLHYLLLLKSPNKSCIIFRNPSPFWHNRVGNHKKSQKEICLEMFLIRYNFIWSNITDFLFL